MTFGYREDGAVDTQELHKITFYPQSAEDVETFDWLLTIPYVNCHAMPAEYEVGKPNNNPGDPTVGLMRNLN